jgi:transposase
LDLYEQAPADGVVVCFDELGPLELRPYAGVGWYPPRHPRRQRATYKRTQGVEQLLAFYDVHDDCLVGQVRKRKTHQDLLAVLARLRTCYPREQRIYLVMDNLNTHRHPLVRAFYELHNIEPVWTPTYASWLNAIEAHFGGVRKSAINGTDEPTHTHRRRRIQRYLTWRNREHGAQACPLARFRYNKLEGH